MKKILLRHYPLLLPIYFKDVAEILPRYCSNTGNILIYHRYEMLMIYFRNTAEILVRYHKNIFILWRYGLKKLQHTAKMLQCWLRYRSKYIQTGNCDFGSGNIVKVDKLVAHKIPSYFATNLVGIK